MGFFSFKTNDTNRSIPNRHSCRKTFPVTMMDARGNKWYEDHYDGYGVFGGMDFFSLVSEMNGGDGSREHGIDLYYQDEHVEPSSAPVFPNLVENSDAVWRNRKPEYCPDQGFFY